MANPSFQELREYGFELNAKAWTTDYKNGAFDSALPPAYPIIPSVGLQTNPNVALPSSLLEYISPDVVEILTAKQAATEIFSEEKTGEWTTPFYRWRTTEYTGGTGPYSDFANNVSSGVNNQWNLRAQYLFQTNIEYGDFEAEINSAAKINFVADKQNAAARAIAIDSNRFYLLGVEGREIYGILNDPNLPDAFPPVSDAGKIAWEDKTTVQRYNDMLASYGRVAKNSGGLVNNRSNVVFLMSPSQAVQLGGATDFNVSVQDMLNKYFTNVEIITVPELETEGGNVMICLVREVMGQRTATLNFGLKLRQGRLVPDESSFRQKFMASTYGGCVRIPFAFDITIGY